jgi:hypothetical protein
MERFVSGKKRENQSMGVRFPFGSVLLFVSFLILCIFTFAVLSLITARNDYQTSKKTAEHESAYYAASNEAEDRIAELNTELKNAGGAGGGVPAGVSFQIPVDDTEVLSVALEAEEETQGPSYRLTRWELVPSGEWNPDQTVPVMTPDVTE